jgi:two-component system, OmpR family, KDP operon response regulator KdpE
VEQRWRKLLIVSDEPVLMAELRSLLSGSSFDVSEARTGEEAITVLRRAPADIVLLNIRGTTGLAACNRIRTAAPLAGVIMTTVRESAEEGVQALDAGADDFVTKPYRQLELIARLRAVPRRLNYPTEAVLHAGDLEIDFERRKVRKHGADIHLTPKEFDLLAYLFRHPGVTIFHSKLLRAVWGLEYGSELEYLRTYVRALRKKIEDNPARPAYILTEPWVGYRFCDRLSRAGSASTVDRDAA